MREYQLGRQAPAGTPAGAQRARRAAVGRGGRPPHRASAARQRPVCVARMATCSPWRQHRGACPHSRISPIGYVKPVEVVTGVDALTGQLRHVRGYRLDREQEAVRYLLEQGSATLHPAVELSPSRATTAGRRSRRCDPRAPRRPDRAIRWAALRRPPTSSACSHLINVTSRPRPREVGARPGPDQPGGWPQRPAQHRTAYPVLSERLRLCGLPVTLGLNC